jgi:chromosome segregation ATPase
MRDDEPTGVSSSGTTDEQEKTVPLRLYAELERKYEQLVDRVERVELSRDAAHRRIDELEDQIEDEKSGVQADETGSQDPEMLPIERIARLKESDDDPEDNPFADTTPSVDRAVTIFEHFREWSKKAPSGRVIRDNLRNLLNTATGERLAWKQVYRACRKLEEWSKGAIEFVQHDRHGWILVQEQPSSVSTG